MNTYKCQRLFAHGEQVTKDDIPMDMYQKCHKCQYFKIYYEDYECINPDNTSCKVWKKYIK